MQQQKCSIGFVTSELSPVTRGGAGVLQFQVARELLARGHDVHILLDAPAQLAAEFRRDHQANLLHPCAFSLTSMAELLGADQPPSAGPASWYQKKSAQWYLALRAWLNHVKPDVIEFPDFYGFSHTAIAAHRWLGLAGETQFAIRLHLTMEQIQEQEIGCYVDRAALFMQEQERLALMNADAALSASNAYRQLIVRKYALRPDRVIVSPPTLDDNPPPVTRKDPGDTVLFVARLFHFKGADTFVDAAVHLLESGQVSDPNLRFVAVGYDSHMGPGLTPFEQHLRKRIPARLASRFEFPGHLTPQQVAQWLSRALCYVCPSRAESFAYTVHEAAAAGVPLVLTNIEAFTDYFTDQLNCLKFDGSAGDLAAKLALLLNDARLQARLGQPQTTMPHSLGNSYEDLARRARHARQTPANSPPANPPDLLAVVLPSAAATDGPFTPASQAIRQAWPHARIVHLEPARDSSANTVPLFGRLWAANGQTVTSDAILICLESDRFDPDYLRAAGHAMSAHADLGCITPSAIPPGSPSDYVCEPLDVQLAVWPILHKTALTRSILRTTPGKWLGDLFDRRVEAYGEIAYLWALQDRNLHTLQWPTASAVLAETDITLADPAILQSMLLRGGNPRRTFFQSAFLAQLLGKTTETLVVGPQPAVVAPPSTLRRFLRRLKQALR